MNVPDLELRDLAYRYPDGTPGLAGVNLAIAPGERVALLGANGAGKSTLLLLMAGMLQGEGEVLLKGIALERTDRRQVRRTIGLLFQDPDDQLFCPSVKEDAVFGPLNLGATPEEADRKAEDALRRTGIARLAGRPAHHLSLGERKRAALASVLSMNPSILLMDEPTSNLDPRGRRELLGILREVGGTQVVATHNLEFAKALCSRGLLLSEGRIAADKPLDSLASDLDLLEKYGLR